jgi:hypothetical protein
VDRASREPEWGEPCAFCHHPHLVHRGSGHAGPCASVECAISLDGGWARESWCIAYTAPDDDPPIPDDPMTSGGVKQPVAESDRDAPYARVREGGNA